MSGSRRFFLGPASRQLRAPWAMGALAAAWSALACPQREPPPSHDASRNEFRFASGRAVIAIADTVSTGGVRGEFIRRFSKGFERPADSLRRAGYSVGLSLVGSRDTVRVTLGADSFRLHIAPSSFGYYLLEPGRSPFFFQSGLQPGELELALNAWEHHLPEPPHQVFMVTVPPPPDSTTTGAGEPVAIGLCGHPIVLRRTSTDVLREETARPSVTRVSDDLEPVARAVAFARVESDTEGVLGLGYSASPGYRVGVFMRGPYAGYDLVLARYDASPCKGEGCIEAGVRFAKRGRELVYLSNLSSPCSADINLAAFAKTLGLHLSVDSSYHDSRFGYPPSLSGPKPGETIYLTRETTYGVDPAGRLLVPHRYSNARDVLERGDVVFRDQVLGEVYTHDDLLFYTFRPDSSALEYRYYPDIGGRTFHWSGEALQLAVRLATDYGPAPPGYVDATDPCAISPDLALDITDRDRELVAVGDIEGRGPLYTYRDSQAPFLRGLFDGRLFQSEGDSAAPRPPSYHAFLAAKPVFFWRDPFGRLERFFDGRYRPPCMAEPILYLYPERRERVEVRVNIQGHVVAAEPPYRQAWQLDADPTGTLIDIGDGTRYAYLYWEGWSRFVRTPTRGYVLAAAEVGDFFRRILPRLGLTREETADFTKAWLPRFTGTPFYFITFLSPSEIDRIAPLRVRPEPQTVIRVFMDYHPLRVRVPAIRPKLPRLPERRGFTVVEWGGLTR